MNSDTPDVARRTSPRSPHAGTGRTASGLTFALASAAAFGLSGSLARGLLETGWSAGAAAGVRMGVAAVVVAVPAALAMRGRWHLVRRAAPTVLLYGLLAVAGAQLCYFYAVQTLDVGVALLVEYTSPVAVVLFLWVTRGERPGRSTVLGALVAVGGLALVLGLVSGVTLDGVGVLWSLGAMIGAATYFLVSADDRVGLPPVALAGGGLLVGSAALGLGGLVGVLPMTASTADATLGDVALPWWLLVGLLGVVTAALAYVTGIAAGRRLGSRVASFVALSEVLMAVLFAWLLLDELPTTAQLLGGLLVLAGVVLVKVGEPRHVEEHGATSPTVEPLPPT
ncbi:MAG: DMT family transporter [Aeromicrobium erythreum]